MSSPQGLIQMQVCHIYGYVQIIPLALAILVAQALIVIRVWAICAPSTIMLLLTSDHDSLKIVTPDRCFGVSHSFTHVHHPPHLRGIRTEFVGPVEVVAVVICVSVTTVDTKGGSTLSSCSLGLTPRRGAKSVNLLEVRTSVPSSPLQDFVKRYKWIVYGQNKN